MPDNTIYNARRLKVTDQNGNTYILDPTSFEAEDFTGATENTDGEHGLVPVPLSADRDKYLKGDGTWHSPAFIFASEKGAANGVAELDSGGKVPANQLPSYVDDVLEYDSYSNFPETGEAGKIYVAKDTRKTYRWSGSGYIELSSYSEASQSSSGLMSASDKAKLDGIAAGAQVNPTNAAIVNLIYPVGSIYMSVNSASPATLFGGEWTQLKDRFLLGAGDTYEAGNTGGSASVSYTPVGTNSGGAVGSHTLTTDEIPSHNHTFTGSAVTSGGQSQGHTHTFTTGNQSQDHTHTTTTGNQSAGHTHTGPSHTHTGPSHTHSVGAHSHGLNSHKHSVGAHAHGLNSHKHSVGAHSHGLNSHTHTIPEHTHAAIYWSGNNILYVDTPGSGASQKGWKITGLAETTSKIVTTGAGGSGNTGAASGSTANSSAFDSGAASGSTANSTAFDSGAASGSTANSTAFDSGAAGTGSTGASGTGNTGGISANHTHTGTSGGVSKNHTHSGTSDGANQGHTHSVTAAGTIGSTGGGGGHTHGFTNPTFTGTAATINTMPPYLAVYMWKRTA